jgi:hypothetical protein
MVDRPLYVEYTPEFVYFGFLYLRPVAGIDGSSNEGQRHRAGTLCFYADIHCGGVADSGLALEGFEIVGFGLRAFTKYRKRFPRTSCSNASAQRPPGSVAPAGHSTTVRCDA